MIAREWAPNRLERFSGVETISRVLTALLDGLEASPPTWSDECTPPFRATTRPTPLVVGLSEDAFGSRDELMAENALLRQQLMAIRREVRAEQAKQAFDRALAEFQAECPTIQKTAKVMNKDGRTVRYQYAPLDAIISQVKGLLQKHGFSYTVNAEAKAKSVKATCKLTHACGHSQESEFEVPIDPDAYMNPAQQVASALTFAKRYAFCNSAGIMTGDADDDSQASGKETGVDSTKTSQKTGAKTDSAPSAKGNVPQGTKHAETDEQRKARWLKCLADVDLEAATAYGIEVGWILPNEVLTDMNIQAVPKTKAEAEKHLAAIRARMPAGGVL